MFNDMISYNQLYIYECMSIHVYYIYIYHRQIVLNKQFCVHSYLNLYICICFNIHIQMRIYSIILSYIHTRNVLRLEASWCILANHVLQHVEILLAFLETYSQSNRTAGKLWHS